MAMRKSMKKAMKAKKGGSKKGSWVGSVAAARKALGIKGFCPCGGKSKEGQALYKKAKEIHGKK